MTRRIKMAAALLSVVLLAVLVTGIGVSAAIWLRPGGETGGSTVGADTDTRDWNLYAKYFECVEVKGDGDTTSLAITKFYSDETPAGLNLAIMIIPNAIEQAHSDLPQYEGGAKRVTEIRSSAFADTVLKELIVELYIPSSIKVIDPLTFMGMPNLEKVVFESGSQCNVGAYAFANCPKLIVDNIDVGKDSNIKWGTGNPI